MDTPSGQRTLTKNPDLPVFIDHMENETFNVMNWYGYPLAFENHYSPSNIFQALLGARHAQLSNQTLFQKPLVLAVYYNYTREINYLNNAILRNEWGAWQESYQNGYEKRYNSEDGIKIVKNLIDGMNLRNNFFTGYLYEENVMQRIFALKDRQIFLLSMGPLPLSVMNGLFSYATKFPPIREGASSLNLLAQTGLAHLRCSAGSGWELNCEQVDADLQKQLSILYRKFCNWGNGYFEKWPEVQDAIPMLGQFIVDSQNTTSSLAKCFKHIQKKAEDPQDRIAVGFERVAELSQKRNSNYSPAFFVSSRQPMYVQRSPHLESESNFERDSSNFLYPFLAVGSLLLAYVLILGLFKKGFCTRKQAKTEESAMNSKKTFRL